MAWKRVTSVHYGMSYQREAMERKLEEAVAAAKRGMCVRIGDGRGEIYRSQNARRNLLSADSKHFFLDGVLEQHFSDGDWASKLDSAFKSSIWADEPAKEAAPRVKRDRGNDDLLGPVDGEEDDDPELVEPQNIPTDFVGFSK